jgi:hypothetical protein
MRREMIGGTPRGLPAGVAHAVAGSEHLLAGVDHDRSSGVGSIRVAGRC